MTGKILFALGAFATVVQGRDLADLGDQGHSYFKIEQPAQLAGVQRHTNVYYGEPVYGEEYGLDAKIVFIENVDDACQDFTHEELEKGRTYIFFFERSTVCSPYIQAQVAQSRGAAAVVLGSSECLCDEQSKDTDLFNRYCDKDSCRESWPQLTYSGESIVTVPTIVVPKLDALRMSDCLQSQLSSSYELRASTRCEAGEDVFANVYWSLPKPDGNVEWELFQNAGSTSGVAAITDDFVRFAVAVSSRSTFTPHFPVQDHYGCEKEERVNLPFCQELCSEGGRYCLNYHNVASYPGRELVESSLRQSCVWESQFKDSYSKNETHAELYWKYRKTHNEMCSYDNKRDIVIEFSEYCDKEAHIAAGLSFQKTMQCVAASGGYGGFDHQNTGKPYNKIFDKTLARQRQLNVVALPSLTVNEVVIKGGASTNSVMKNVCTGYKDGTEPRICVWAEKHDFVKDQLELQDYLNAPQGFTTAQTVGIVVGSVLCIALLALLYTRSTRARLEKGMRDEMNEILRRYVPMDEVDGEQQPVPNRNTQDGENDSLAIA